MEKLLNDILNKLNTLQDDVTSLKQGQNDTKKELNTIKTVTAKNCYDITHLKAIK